MVIPGSSIVRRSTDTTEPLMHAAKHTLAKQPPVQPVRTVPSAVRARRAVVPSLDGGGPIWQQIRRALVGPILDGEWPPGTRIPSEMELAQRFGASRMTVCKAIQSLATDGLVQRRRKSGTVVAERALERPVFEIWDIADLITRAGASYAFRLLECCKLAQDPERRELLGVSSRTPTLWLRCLHLSDDKPFQLEERLVNVDAAPGITCHPLETESPGRWLLARVPWTDAEHKILAREAPPEVAAELQIRPRTACLVVERRTWNGSMPVTYARLWNPGVNHGLIGRFQPAR
jgi:GntR family transcriptional regulator, histidine utilization repressor